MSALYKIDTLNGDTVALYPKSIIFGGSCNSFYIAETGFTREHVDMVAKKINDAYREGFEDGLDSKINEIKNALKIQT